MPVGERAAVAWAPRSARSQRHSGDCRPQPPIWWQFEFRTITCQAAERGSCTTPASGSRNVDRSGGQCRVVLAVPERSPDPRHEPTPARHETVREVGGTAGLVGDVPETAIVPSSFETSAAVCSSPSDAHDAISPTAIRRGPRRGGRAAAKEEGRSDRERRRARRHPPRPVTVSASLPCRSDGPRSALSPLSGMPGWMADRIARPHPIR